MIVSIVVPVFNEGEALLSFLRQLIQSLEMPPTNFQTFSFKIVIVDDGSKKPIKILLNDTPTACHQTKIYLLRHSINLGQGAALQTGIEFARDMLASDYFVTMDSDGQHSEKDLFPMLMHLINSQHDIIFGNRFIESRVSNMPKSRLLLLKVASLFERKLTGLKLGDAHNGFRAFNRVCSTKIDLKLNRMAHATEFKQIVSQHSLKYSDFPVSIRYSSESLAKGQKNSGALIILRDLFKTYLFERF